MMNMDELRVEWYRNLKQEVELLEHHPLLIDWIENGSLCKNLSKHSTKNKVICRDMEFDFAHRIAKRYLNIDLNKHGQWTTVFGESLVKYGFDKLYNESNIKPTNKFTDMYNGKRLMPDMYTEHGSNLYIKEVKSRNYVTSGTAGEKITNVAWKYADIIDIPNSKLYIVCVGYQEYEANEYFGLFKEYEQGTLRYDQKELWKKHGIEFIAFSSVIQKLRCR